MRIWSGLIALVGATLVVFGVSALRSGRRGSEAAAVAPPVDDVMTAPSTPFGGLAAALRSRLWAPSSAEPPVPSDRAPAVPAPLAAELDARARERDLQMAGMRDSGADSDDLAGSTKPIRRLFEAMGKGPSPPIGVDPWECYRAGCFATVVERSDESVEALTTKLLASDEVTSWPGASMRSATIQRADGAYESTWFFLAPQDGGQGLAAASTEQ